MKKRIHSKFQIVSCLIQLSKGPSGVAVTIANQILSYSFYRIEEQKCAKQYPRAAALNLGMRNKLPSKCEHAHSITLSMRPFKYCSIFDKEDLESIHAHVQSSRTFQKAIRGTCQARAAVILLGEMPERVSVGSQSIR